MDYKIECKKCNSLMYQIGPFATLKPEGQPTEKWDGLIDFECTNQECENVGKIIKLKPF